MEQPNPSKIFETGMAFMQSKVLLSAIDLDLFTVLANGGMTAAQIGERLALHPRSTRDFLDGLVSMGFLNREGSGRAGIYANTTDTNLFLDKNKPSYIGGILEMANNRLYPFWGNLTEGLKTGEPQNEISGAGGDFFAELYANEALLEEFMRAMAGNQIGNFMMLAEIFDFSQFKSMCDVGGANGALASAVAARHPNIACSTLDLPPVKPLAERAIEARGLSDRIEVLSGSFFDGPLPNVEVITMGNILHDWDEEQKLALMKKAFDALPTGGALIAIEMVIDDERRKNTMGLMMSLNMLIETPGGFDYTHAQFDSWAKSVGFASTELRQLTGPTSAAIAWKG